MESINQVDEVKLLGYFETIKSVFLLKLILLVSFTKDDNKTRRLDVKKIPVDAISSVQSIFNDAVFYKALQNGNEELYANLQEDIVTTVVGSSWAVFEQLIKDLSSPDYSTSTKDLSIIYQNGKFQFDTREKKDLDLFYYIRNATQHYNGAYHAYRAIDHQFGGTNFKSIGHHGEKIDVNIKTAWEILCTLERYAMKAWSNSKKIPIKPQGA